MLIVGTTAHLEDLDREYTLASDTSVSAVTSIRSGSGRPQVWALLDGERVVRLEELEVVPIAQVSQGQSMAAANDGLLIGHEGARASFLDARGGEPVALSSFESVPGRGTWENPAAATPDLRSVAVTTDGTWFLNVHVGGVWRSDDRGASWVSVIEPDADVHEVVASDGRVAVAAAAGFASSDDKGETWRWTTGGLHAAYARAVALDGDVCYVTTSTGPRTTDGRLYRGRIGEDFVQCRGGLPESFPYNLDTGSLTAADGAVALGTRDGHVFRSLDGGSSFDLIAERMRPVQVLRYC